MEHPGYAALSSAVSSLNTLISGAPTAEQLTQAMAMLTQAMAGAR